MEECRKEDAYEDIFEEVQEKLTRIITEVDVIAYGMEVIYRAGASDDYVPAACFWQVRDCLLYTSPSPRDYAASRMPSSA